MLCLDWQQLNIFVKEKLYTKDLENEKKQVKKNGDKISNNGDASTFLFTLTLI